MLSPEEASERLRPLAEPTITAFTSSRRQYVEILKASKTTRDKMAMQVDSLLSGVDWWCIFATELVGAYGAAGFARDPRTHPLAHVWPIDDEIVVRLKSDTGNLPLQQMMIPGIPAGRDGEMEHVILTYSHEHEERFDPAFVQMEGARERWRIPVAVLEMAATEAVRPERAKSTVSANLPPPASGEQQAEDATSQE